MPQYPIRHLADPPVGGINLPKLVEEARTAYGDCGVNTVLETGMERPALYLPEGSLVTQVQWQTLVSAHDASAQTTDQLVAAQRADADTDLSAAWNGALHQLPVRDAVIVLWARRLAQIRSDVVTINTKAQAAAYWDGEMTAAGNEAGRLQVQRDSFQALLELIAVALVR